MNSLLCKTGAQKINVLINAAMKKIHMKKLQMREKHKLFMANERPCLMTG